MLPNKPVKKRRREETGQSREIGQARRGFVPARRGGSTLRRLFFMAHTAAMKNVLSPISEAKIIRELLITPSAKALLAAGMVRNVFKTPAAGPTSQTQSSGRPQPPSDRAQSNELN